MSLIAGLRSIACVLFLLCLSGWGCGQTYYGSYNVNMDVIRNSVVFLHTRDAKTGELKGAGTGFLLQVPLKSDKNRGYWLLATARHIVDPQWAGCKTTREDETVSGVFNKKSFNPEGTETGTIEVQLSGPGRYFWHFPSDSSVDIAVAILNAEALSKLTPENTPINFSQLPTQAELDAVNTGAPVLSAGLLLGVSGNRRNYPVFKFGNVSSKPQEKISMACCPDCPATPQTEWMIAASLVPGNSGSPIIYAPPLMPLGGTQRAFVLGVQSSAMIGDDIAGMAPISYLIGVVRDLNLNDADLAPAVPSSNTPVSTSGVPSTQPMVGPLKEPK